MVYLVSGQQNIRLKSQLKKIVAQSIEQTDPMNFVKYDATQCLIDDFLDDANSLPLGYDHKIVVVENCYFLLKQKKKGKEEAQKYEKIVDYIEHSDEMIDLIFLVNTSENELDTGSDIYKAIEKHGHVIAPIKEPDEKQWPEVVKKFFKEKWPEVVIDSLAVGEFARRTAGDYASLINNGNKLALYTNHIRLEDVALMVTKPLEENAFKLFNFLMDENSVEAISLFRDLKDVNVETATLISMIANQFRLLNRVSYLYKQGFDDPAIGKELKITNPKRVEILRKKTRLISQKKINQTLDDLYQLDLKIKSGLLDRYHSDYSFELFLINFKRN